MLVVEDDADSRVLLRFILERCGYEVEESQAADGGSGLLHLAARLQPDLILLDISYLNPERLEFLQQMRAQIAFRELPIIITSAYPLPSFREQALAAGCNDFFLKPIDFDQLVKAIEQALTLQ